MSLQCLEHTPSVYFNFDDASNKNTNTHQLLFDLSCTNQKLNLQILPHIESSILDLGQSVQKPLFQRLKTQEFFEQFDNHFVVTFQEGTKEAFNVLESTAVSPFQKQNLDPNMNIQKQISQVFLQSNFSLQQQLRRQTSQFDFKQQIMPTTSYIREQLEDSKERESPIPAFEVKKRTVFKSKQNISCNAQTFKITKKKLINQNTLQKFMSYPKSEKLPEKPHQIEVNCSKTSKITQKNMLQSRIRAQNVQNLLDKKIVIQRKSKSTIFQPENKGLRQTFRSTTLDNWKRKFNRQKRSVQQTVKRTNIFHKPFSII